MHSTEYLTIQGDESQGETRDKFSLTAERAIIEDVPATREIIKAALEQILIDEGPNPSRVRLLPRLAREEVDEFGKSLPVPPSDYVRDLLKFCSGTRRCTRLTNAFSKKWENHWAAMSLWYTFYNFCRIHKSRRVTPAMAAGITDRVWDVRDLLT